MLINENDPISLNFAINQLEDGKIIVFPTETIYALACSAENIDAINKIYSIKKRPKTKPLSLIVNDLNMLKNYAHITDTQEEIIKKNSPGPFTYILEVKKKYNYFGSSIGLRIPDYEFCLNLIQKFGKAICATSCNFSEEKSANNVSDIDKDLIANLDLIIDGGECKYSMASTVVDIREKPFKILRNGPKEII